MLVGRLRFFVVSRSEITVNRVSVLLYAVLHTNLDLSSEFALNQLPRITSEHLVLFQLILQGSSDRENAYNTTVLVTSQNAYNTTILVTSQNLV